MTTIIIVSRMRSAAVHAANTGGGAAPRIGTVRAHISLVQAFQYVHIVLHAGSTLAPCSPSSGFHNVACGLL